MLNIYISSVQFICSVMSDSLRPHESQRARPPCPSPTPGVYSNSCIYIYIYIYTNTDIVPNLAIYHIVTIVHSAIMNIVVYMSFQLVFSFPSNKQMLYECNVHIVNIANNIMY